MNKERFDKFMEAVKEGAEFLKGGATPDLKHEIRAHSPQIESIRETLKCSQVELAQILGVSLRTIQKWERTHTAPKGPNS